MQQESTDYNTWIRVLMHEGYLTVEGLHKITTHEYDKVDLGIEEVIGQ